MCGTLDLLFGQRYARVSSIIVVVKQVRIQDCTDEPLSVYGTSSAPVWLKITMQLKTESSTIRQALWHSHVLADGSMSVRKRLPIRRRLGFELHGYVCHTLELVKRH